MTTRFVQALLNSATPVVAELKRRDADGRDLFGGRTVEQVVTAYTNAGFPCLSVVTGRWFGGTPDLLAEVARHTALPILLKDFVVRESQLVWARQQGASAVLLTAGLLPAPALRRLAGQALALGLTPFVEVTGEAEIAALGPAQQCVVAVNTKDIRVKERGAPDLGRARRLLPAVVASGGCPAVASGIESPRTAAEFAAAGYQGLLIGSSLLRSASLTDWRHEFATELAAAVPAAPGRRAADLAAAERGAADLAAADLAAADRGVADLAVGDRGAAGRGAVVGEVR